MSERASNKFRHGMEARMKARLPTSCCVTTHNVQLKVAAGFDQSAGDWCTAACRNPATRGGDGSVCTTPAGLYAGFCDEHGPVNLGVEIRRTSLLFSDTPGVGEANEATLMLGLFTTSARTHGDVISAYDGDVLTEDAYRARYTRTVDAHYCLVVCVPDHPRTLVCIDARSSQACVARFANDGTPNKVKNNCRFIRDVDAAGQSQVRMVACRDIAAGAELLVDYGREFWGGRGA